MASKEIPEPFGFDQQRFRDLFSAPSFEIFTLLLIGWVVTVGIHTISRVILTMGLERMRHFASVYRFFSRSVWSEDSISRRLFLWMVEVLLEAGCDVTVLLDDTLNKHRGRKICGSAWQHDGAAPKGAASPFAWGVCFVVIGLAVRLPGISQRVFCLPFAARLWWPESAQVKPEGRVHRTKQELALELIELTRSWLDQARILRVVTDIGYCCATVMKGLPDGVHLTGRARKDSSLYALAEKRKPGTRGRPRKKGTRLPTPQEMFQDPGTPWKRIKVSTYGKTKCMLVHSFRTIWYHPAGNRPLLFVLVRDPKGSQPDSVFVDTDLDSTAAETVVRYAARWSIEITNREVKHLLGSADPQCRTEKAVVRAPMMALWAYSLVVLWFVRHHRSGRRFLIITGPWYRSKKDISFGDMLAAARRSRFTLGISAEARENLTLTKFDCARCTRGYESGKNAKV